MKADRLQELDAWLDSFRRLWAGSLEALSTEVARGKRARRKSAGKAARVTGRKRTETR